MKKIFTKLMLLAVAAAALVSCENKIDESTPVVELTQTVTLTAEKPVEVRTEMIEGVPYWSKGDAIGVYVDESKHYKFTNDAEEATLTTSFTGQTAVANTLFVYYPYTANGVAEKGAKVDIPANQEPTATSFDGKADIMLAKPITLDAEGKQLNNLEFARLGAIVKIVLKDNTSSLAGQHVSSLTMTAANNLVGRVYIDVVNQELGELYYGGSKSVTATYTEATQYEVNGTNATYVIVYPQTLAAGSTLSFEAATEGYAISKSIELGQDIVLESGKLTTLTVNLAAANVVKEETGLDLPIEDDFAWATGTSGVTPNKEWWSSDFAYTYGNNGELRLGKSGECGHITTSDLNLSEPFTVVVDAKAWSTETSQVAVTAGGVTQKSENLPLEAAGFKTFVFKFDAVGSKEAIKIEITGKRGFIDNLKIVAGHDYVLPAVLTVSTAEISGVSHEGEAKTFTYSVTNPVDGVSATVTDNADWITTADNNGTVTVTVAENTLEEVRNATITVKYGDLTETIAVQQNAKPAAGEVVKTWTLLTSASDLAVGDEIIIAAKGSNYALSTTQGSNNRGQAAITKSGNTLATPASDVQILTVMAGSTSGSFAFYADAPSSTVGYLYCASTSSKNYLRTQTTLDAKASWTVSIANDGTATVKSNVSGIARNLMSYNSSSSCFACYSSTQAAICIYKLVGESGGEGGETPETPATPVLSVNPTTLSFDAAAGSKTITCTIENEVSGQNVTATSSDTSWLTTSVSGKTVTVTATANTGAARNATVTIAYTGAESKTVTVSQAAGNTGGGEAAKVWTLVTDASTLKAGDQIIIAVNSKSATASATISSSYMNVITTTVFSSDKNTITTVGSGTAILTLGGSAGAWTLTNESGQKLGTSAAKKVAWGSGTTTWTIAISSKNATIKCTNTTYGWLQYNASNPRFTTYTSNQTLPQIYRLQ